MDLSRLILHEDLTGIGLNQTERDAHECGLARPVLTEQSEDLTRTGLEVDPVARYDRAEPLGDPAELDDRTG
jgi:hypothetical protein